VSLPSPRLDDRRFDDLLAEAKAWIQRRCPEWTDLSPGDPGLTLVELFAFLTEVLLYRVNRLPEKVHVELLRLLGVQLRPPAAAQVTLRFRRQGSGSEPLAIPAGTRVTVGRAAGGATAPEFATEERVEFAAGQGELEVTARCCEWVEAELAGRSDGQPGQAFRARRAPLIAPLPDRADLVVGVEWRPEDGEVPRDAAIGHGGRTFRVWREVQHFATTTASELVYVADRSTGTVQFPPALESGAVSLERVPLERLPLERVSLGAVPPQGREVRLWYRCGGGAQGNVGAGQLTVLRDPLPGVSVTNPGPATGGREAETLEHAQLRGPLEFRSLERALTAEDFEQLALRASGAVARARAATRAGLWAHARPGTVEVLLVPALAPELLAAGRLRREDLLAHQLEADRAAVARELDQRRALGTALTVQWARYKTVAVRARIVTFREQDPEQVRARLLERLERTLCPLATDLQHRGWAFDQPLRVFTVYDLVRAEPGVRYAEDVQLVVDEVPDRDVATLAADLHQPRTWFAGAADGLYRSTNDGAGWERMAHWEGELLHLVECDPTVPGRGGAGTRRVGAGDTGGDASAVYLSTDCGESWTRVARTAFRISDLAFQPRAEGALLWLASDRGLYELPLLPGASPLQVLVDRNDPDLGFTNVVVAPAAQGAHQVAVAAQQDKGVYVSAQSGRNDTFRAAGLAGHGIAALAVQTDGPRARLWAGVTAAGGGEGLGAAALELRREDQGLEQWSPFAPGWTGGTCTRLAVDGALLLAGTHRGGVLRLETGPGGPHWSGGGIEGGLPLRDQGRLHTVEALAAAPGRERVLAGGAAGVWRADDGGRRFVPASVRATGDAVPLPHGWLFCSGEHQLEVLDEGSLDRSAARGAP
jgi:hypothetical protein